MEEPKVPDWELKRRKYPNKFLRAKPCRYCGENFNPTAPSHLYCSDPCKAKGTVQRHYKSSYGLSYDDVKSLHDKQNGKCAICGGEGFKMSERVYTTLNVDHCHKTGVVRGLLCHNCNRGLGLFQDDVDRLKSAIAYLEGATTISKESTYKCTEAHSPSQEGDDIV